MEGRLERKDSRGSGCVIALRIRFISSTRTSRSVGGVSVGRAGAKGWEGDSPTFIRGAGRVVIPSVPGNISRFPRSYPPRCTLERPLIRNFTLRVLNALPCHNIVQFMLSSCNCICVLHIKTARG